MRIAPSDVFVPGKFPIKESNVYADRGTPQSDTRVALTRGFVPLVFGGYGVGKSSMVMRVAQDFTGNHTIVYIENVFGKSLSSIFERILEEIGYEVISSRSSRNDSSSAAQVGAEVSGSAFWVLTAKLKSALTNTRSEGESVEHELVVKSPTESKMLDLCEEHHILLVVDELHRADKAFSEQFSAFLKAYANRNCSKFKIALLGTENEASRLVINDPGTDRLIEEVALQTLSDKEADEIIKTGFGRLDLTIETEVTQSLKALSVGSPFVLQFLCLEVAEACWRRSNTCPTADDVENALKTYARRKAQRLIREYRAAIETVGDKRYRKQILSVMANSEDEYVTMEYLVDEVSSKLGESIPSTALSGPLRALKTDKFGRILRDVENPAGGGRLANYSGFTDPAMKSVIRMIEIAGSNLVDEV